MEDNRAVGRSTQQASTRNGQRKSWLAPLFSTLIRLAVWFCIITIFFRCPSSSNELSDSSPRICAPYIDLKARVAPYTAPYYQAYAAPYVEKAQPYAETFNTKVYTPARDFARSKYNTYGAARVAQGQAYIQEEWDSRGKPWMQKGRDRASGIYDQFLATHVDQAYDTVSPRVKQAKDVGVDQYQTVVIPTYNKAQPYLQQWYNRSYQFTTQVGYPYVIWLVETATDFVARRMWPPIRILYGENVLPQLMKIKERLASYRDAKRLVHIMQEAETSISSSGQTTASSDNLDSSVTSAMASTTSVMTSPPDSTTSMTTNQQARQVSEDLKIWQTKFAKAADKGAEGLQQRIVAISVEQIEQQAKGTGEALLVSLEESAKSAVEDLKAKITEIVASLPQEDDSDSDAEDAAKESAHAAVRSAGKTIKSAAEHLRAWRHSYDANTASLITAASDSVLEVVDNIRDLGLQEIGMRWASMDDGVSYKDWSEYHTMRKTFAEWRGTVQSVIAKHEGPERARKVGEDIEARGMAVAEDAARELARLKEVAGWKIAARDVTDNFRTKYAPPGAARAAKKVKAKVGEASEAVDGSSTGTMESIASKASSVADAATASVKSGKDAAASSVSSVVDPVTSSASSLASSGSAAVASQASSASTALAAKASTTLGPNGESETRASRATEAAQSVTSSVAHQVKSASSSAASYVQEDTDSQSGSGEGGDLSEEL